MESPLPASQNQTPSSGNIAFVLNGQPARLAADDPRSLLSILREDFGWRVVRDLGDLTGARPLEMQVLMWLRLYNALGTPDFNVHVVKR